MLCISWITHLAEANWGGDSVAGLMVAHGRGAVEAGFSQGIGRLVVRQEKNKGAA